MRHSNIIIITGLSGSGKSTAASAFEDAGYYCVDNMPVELLPKFLELPVDTTSDVVGFCFVMDLREKHFLLKYHAIFNELTEKGYNHEIIFLEANETVLLRRFSQTRRQHPLSSESNLTTSIREEKSRLDNLRKAAHRIIDTSDFDYHKLKSVIRSIAQKHIEYESINIHIMSFGFKYGVPQETDLIMDVRFLQNPYFIPHLQPLSGLDDNVRDYVLNSGQTKEFLNKFKDLIDFLIPLYKKEGKSYLTIAIGCTGGRHRSVAVSTDIFNHIKKKEHDISITHRDIDL